MRRGAVTHGFQVRFPSELTFIPLLNLLFESFKPNTAQLLGGVAGLREGGAVAAGIRLGGVRGGLGAPQGEAGTSSQSLYHGCPRAPAKGSRAGDKHKAGTPDHRDISRFKGPQSVRTRGPGRPSPPQKTRRRVPGLRPSPRCPCPQGSADRLPHPSGSVRRTAPK